MIIRALALVVILLGARAWAEDEVVIIVKSKSPTAEAHQQQQQPAVPTYRGEYIRAVWQHPDQTFVDSDIGPLPLYTEVVYDGTGTPRPRIPDALTKIFMDNPSEDTALLYLEGQKVRVRRYNQAASVMQRTAIDHGYVTPDVFAAPPGKMPQDSAFVPPYDRDRSEWGVPVMNPEQARLAGVKPDEIPETPGRVTTRYVEVLYIWDHRCPFSMQGIRAFADFGEELFTRELGPRAITISMDNDEQELFKVKGYLEYIGVPLARTENFTDITDLRTKLRITRTPTYIFIDRRTGKVLRLEGLQPAEALRGKLLELVGHESSSWSSADPTWFRPAEAAATASGTPSDGPQAIDPALLEGSSPVLPASRAVRSWNPAGQAD